MSNLPRNPHRAFSEILQSWDQDKLLQKEGQKKTLARKPPCPLYDFLQVPTQHNILLQTAPLKVPVVPSYVKFTKGPPARVF